MTRLLASFCLVASSAFASAQGGMLLYSGLTQSNGWQIFRYECQSKVVLQLSFSPGDKRDPLFSHSLRAILCRNSLGEILRLSGTNESLYLTNLHGCANFALAPDGESTVFTKPLAGNRRQDIFRQEKGAAAPLLVASVPEGMLKQVAVSPDGLWLAATHIWRDNEERLVVFPAGKGEPIRYLTPDRNIDAFPSWTPDSKCILFSSATRSRSYALNEVRLEPKEVTTVLSRPASSLCHPVSDSTGQFIFFEERTPQQCSIACLNRKTGEVRPLSLPHEAREPYWYENN